MRWLRDAADALAVFGGAFRAAVFDTTGQLRFPTGADAVWLARAK
ncbi:MAG TPA: hypothetical protein VLG91_19330 [Streptomyces sp.]|nr:hypothetical protein [Streptomyces sp.]